MRESWLEQRCAELAQQNEALRFKLQDAQAKVDGGSKNSLTSLIDHNSVPSATREVSALEALPMAKRSSMRGGLLTRKNSISTKTELAAMAVAAAAQEAADYQSSLVRVDIDNGLDADATVVIVRTPNRARLLADMSGALSGLAFQILSAKIETEGDHALTTFTLQEGDSSNKKVLDPDRLVAIEQRLQQRFHGEQGLVGGVRRLVVDRFIRSVPPWEHQVLEPLTPDADTEELYLRTLRQALRGDSSLGKVPSAVAYSLALELLGDMTRMQVPPSSSVVNTLVEGEWLLLLETGASVSVSSSSPESISPPGCRRFSTTTPLSSAPPDMKRWASSPGDLRGNLGASPPSSPLKTAAPTWTAPMAAGGAACLGSLPSPGAESGVGVMVKASFNRPPPLLQPPIGEEVADRLPYPPNCSL